MCFLCENGAIKAERVRLVQTGEEKALGRLYSARVLQESWGRIFYNYLLVLLLVVIGPRGNCFKLKAILKGLDWILGRKSF